MQSDETEKQINNAPHLKRLDLSSKDLSDSLTGDLNTPLGVGYDGQIDFIEDDVFVRSKTSLRMHYEAQVEVIKKQSGNLEEIRLKLGLSSRKISQLLMVDPSSWTRWTRQGDSVPPHIWRALQWYLILREKLPGLTPQYFVGQDPKTLHQKALQLIDEEKAARLANQESFQQKVSELELKMSHYRRGLYFFSATTVLLSALLLWRLIYS